MHVYDGLLVSSTVFNEREILGANSASCPSIAVEIMVHSPKSNSASKKVDLQ